MKSLSAIVMSTSSGLPRRWNLGREARGIDESPMSAVFRSKESPPTRQVLAQANGSEKTMPALREMFNRATPLLLCCALLFEFYASASAQKRPNLVVIMADDLGYGELSSYGATDLQSPHIDSLLSRGVQRNSGIYLGNNGVPATNTECVRLGTGDCHRLAHPAGWGGSPYADERPISTWKGELL